MYIVELSLKHTALPMSVQKKTIEAANEAYATILNALKTGQPVVLEMTCDKQEGKKLSVLVSELAGVQVYDRPIAAKKLAKERFIRKEGI